MTIIVTIISASWWFMGLGTTMCTSNTQCCFPKLLSIIKSSSGTFHQPKFCHLILCFKYVLLASLFSIPLYMYRVFILWEECLIKECFLCLCEEIYEFQNQIVVADSRSTLTRRTACPGWSKNIYYQERSFGIFELCTTIQGDQARAPDDGGLPRRHLRPHRGLLRGRLLEVIMIILMTSLRRIISGRPSTCCTKWSG